MLEIRCCHRMADAVAFRGAMNALNELSPEPDPFSSFEFLANIVANAEAFPRSDGFRPWLLLALEGERLVGYAALKQERHRVLGVVATRIDWLAAYVIGRPHVVAREGDAGAVSAAVYAYLLGRRREWSMLAFEQQDATSALLPPPAAFRAPRYRVSSWPDLPHWRIPLRQHSLKSYFSSFSTKFRSNVSRQMRGLMAEGKLELLTASEPHARAALFVLYRGVEHHSWKARAGVDIGHDARSLAYFQGLMADGQPMQIVIQLLVLNELPVAGLISGAFGSGLYALEMVYDERFSQLGPGTAMMFFGVRQAIEGHFPSYDLLRDFGYYKARWQAEMVDNRSLQIYRFGTPYYWRRGIGDAKRAIAGVLEGRAQSLFNPLRRAAGSLGQLSEHAPVACDGIVGTAAERVECGRLLTIARSGANEHLVGQALADVLPFPTTIEALRDTVRGPAKPPRPLAGTPPAAQPARPCRDSADLGSARSPLAALRLRTTRPINR